LAAGQCVERGPGRAHILFFPVRGPGRERETQPDRREGRRGYSIVKRCAAIIKSRVVFLNYGGQKSILKKVELLL